MNQREEAIAYLERFGAPVTEDRILLAEFLAASPSALQIQKAMNVVLHEREQAAKKAREELAFKVMAAFDSQAEASPAFVLRDNLESLFADEGIEWKPKSADTSNSL